MHPSPQPQSEPQPLGQRRSNSHPFLHHLQHRGAEAKRSQFCHSAPTTEPAGLLQGEVSPWCRPHQRPQAIWDLLQLGPARTSAHQGHRLFSRSSPEDTNARRSHQPPGATCTSWTRAALLGHQPGSRQEEQSPTKAAPGALGTGKAQKGKKITNFNKEMCSDGERAEALPEGKPTEGAEPRLL